MSNDQPVKEAYGNNDDRVEHPAVTEARAVFQQNMVGNTEYIAEEYAPGRVRIAIHSTAPLADPYVSQPWLKARKERGNE